MTATAQSQTDVKDEILTHSEMAKFLKISERSLAKLVKNKTIPCFRVGRLVRFRLADVRAWFESQSA